jgi:ParB family chromosome partitioning protein
VSISDKKNPKHGLGRGFESLIPTDLLDESFDPTAKQDQQVSELRQIKLDQIVVDPDQPRKKFEAEDLEELAASIKEHGVLQPIIVTPYKGGYQVVAGERRFRASQMVELDKIPALVRTLTDQHRLEISLIENLQRKDLNVMETATAYLKLRDQFNLTLEQIGKRVGNKSISAVSNKLRLLKLSAYMKQTLIDGELTEGQVRPLIGLDDDVTKKIDTQIIF